MSGKNSWREDKWGYGRTLVIREKDYSAGSLFRGRPISSKMNGDGLKTIFWFFVGVGVWCLIALAIKH